MFGGEDLETGMVSFVDLMVGDRSQDQAVVRMLARKPVTQQFGNVKTVCRRWIEGVCFSIW